MAPTDVFQLVPTLLSLFQQHAWMALAVLVMGFVTRVLKSDTKFPIDIPSRWQPVIVLVLGQAYAGLQAVAGGVAWKTAVTQGLVASFLTMGLFDLVVKAAFDGKDIPPFFTWLLKFERTLDVTTTSSEAKTHLTVDEKVEEKPAEKPEEAPKS